MKKIIYGILSLVVLACSNDDGGSEPNPNAERVIGTWNLTELRISPAQDIDEDGTATANVLDELECVSGEIVIRSDNTWSFSGRDVLITTITGGLFKFSCATQLRTAAGNWDITGNTLRLADDTGLVTSFSFDSTDETLTNTIGQVLPDLQAEVYSKQ